MTALPFSSTSSLSTRYNVLAAANSGSTVTVICCCVLISDPASLSGMLNTLYFSSLPATRPFISMNAFGAVAPLKYSLISVSYSPGRVLKYPRATSPVRPSWASDRLVTSRPAIPNSLFFSALSGASKLLIRKPSVETFASFVLPISPTLNITQSLFRRVS